jgi:AcrR family transcriptional regulator
MAAVAQAPPGEGLRERKKRLTRDALVSTALRLFEQRGFDNVTTAEIADASNVAVKTLFVYFPTKEDLVFADEQTALEELCHTVRTRPPGTSPLAALRAKACERMSEKSSEPLEGLGSFARVIGDNPGLQRRLHMMWERFEQGIAQVLAQERGVPPHDPEVRITATLLLAPVRTLTSTDIRNNHEVVDDVLSWLDRCFDIVARGLGE